MKQIPMIPRSWLKPTLYVMVDDKDYEWLSKFNWCAIQQKDGYRAKTRIGNKCVYMHQLLLPSPDSNLTPDHINRNTLDNQKNNLRLATKNQQQSNRGIQSNNISGYKGVSYFKRDNNWRAYLVCKGVQQHLGYFTSKEEAAKAYNKAALETFGEFASLNEVK